MKNVIQLVTGKAKLNLHYLARSDSYSYKRSVIRFDFNNYSSVVNQLVQFVGSYDHGVYNNR